MRKSLVTLAAAACALAVLVFAPSVRTKIAALTEGIQVFSQSAQQEMTLPQYDVYALQLAVFDSGERAANELKRLQSQGVRCVIWQRERMRIVADAALERDGLNSSAAKGNDAYVIRDTLEAVTLRLSADALGVEQAKRLLEAPDALLHAILKDSETAMEQIAGQAETIAAEALDQPMENTLYTQLAQSLQNWSLLMKKTLETADEEEARSYGAVTMCTLCRELRQTLSALSTASAQRTPSTAADVMPPA
ncbi:MAG: hypothetical protein IJ313_12045 [Clostridia bacterium]|nr:hypothetical protein [Clostridia bacterium]